MSTLNLRMWPCLEIGPLRMESVKVKPSRSRVGPNSDDWRPCKKAIGRHTGKRPRDGGGREWMWPQGWGHLQPPGPRRGGVGGVPWSIRRETALPTPRSQTSGLQNWEKISFWSLKPPSLWCSVLGAPGSYHGVGRDEDKSLICLTPQGKSGPHLKHGELARGLSTQRKPASQGAEGNRKPRRLLHLMGQRLSHPRGPFYIWQISSCCLQGVCGYRENRGLCN